MSSAIDLEAQQVAQAAPPAKGEEGAETHETRNLAGGPPTSSLASPLRSVSAGRDINDDAQPFVSQAEGSGRGGYALGMNITSDRLTQEEAQIPAASSPNVDPGPRNTTPDSEEPRMIGDFDGGANEFWKLYRDEAKSHDDARISTLKEGMDSALIFAGLFSAVLTAFVVDSKQNLKPSPADETIYYLRQHSTILSQISLQLSSIAPQVPIPLTPPPPFPPSGPLASDIRVNVFWFMALAFSLLAALLAILVQQWVRNYMHVFQRYGDPLKSFRLRQYLYEGYERWHMPKVAEAVPGFLHVSLFLFFAGLANSLLNINTKVALSTIVPIGVSGLLYIFTIFAPIIYPQSPYQNMFSSILWFLIQTSRGRRFRDHGSDEEMKSVSADMAQGQMQLAMEESVARKDRDERATRWLIDNLTEDSEMEKFLSAIPGSFNTDWGTEVWKRVGEHHGSEDQGHGELIARPPSDATPRHRSFCWRFGSVVGPIIHRVRKPTRRHLPTHVTTPNFHSHSTTAHIQGEDVVHELSTRVARSVEICKTREVFANHDLWRRRTRGCIETAASLVFCANAKFVWFGGISKLLGDIGSFEKIRELSVAGTDQLYVMRWTCLSFVAIRPILADNRDVKLWEEIIKSFARACDTGDSDALAVAQEIDETLKKAGDCLDQLRDALQNREDLTEEVKDMLRGHESEISELERINIEADRLLLADFHISDIQLILDDNSHHITSQVPGVLDEFDFDCRESIPFSRLVELCRDPRALQFIRPRQTLKSMCSPALTLRNILEGQGDADAYKKLVKNLNNSSFYLWGGNEMQRQMFHLLDLRDGGGFGFTVELFFLALSQLLSTSSSMESHSTLYMGTFRAITSDWSKYKGSLGTQKLLLHIAEEFLGLLRNIFEGQIGSHSIDSIDEAMQELTLTRLMGVKFGDRLLKVFTDIKLL